MKLSLLKEEQPRELAWEDVDVGNFFVMSDRYGRQLAYKFNYWEFVIMTYTTGKNYGATYARRFGGPEDEFHIYKQFSVDEWEY